MKRKTCPEQKITRILRNQKSNDDGSGYGVHAPKSITTKPIATLSGKEAPACYPYHNPPLLYLK
jgi:hypothetical protein